MRTNYQNIKFFNKEGYEIPLAKASNIVVKIYSNEINSERYATIMNGVYMEEVDEEGNYILNNFKILDVGSSFDSENISIDNTIIDLYIDGVLVDSSLYSVKDNLLDFEIESFMTIKTTTMGNNDEEYKKYGISGVNNFSLIIKKDDNIDLIFPSYVFTGNIEMETVSTGLHSTESIYFGIVGDEGELLSVEEDNYDILFLTDVKDEDIQFFTFDDVTEEIYKSHSAYVNLSGNENLDITEEEGFNDVINIQKHIATPQYVNFCCVSNEEGVHQQIIYVMLVDRKNKSNQYKIGEFNVIVNFEGEDERFRALFANFGIPDPITYPTLFKSANIKENSIDWTLVNRKSKELFLSYDEIFPYVGTYKALTNAIKFLGYDDVYFREWYKDIKNNLFISKRIDINSTFNDFKLNLTYDDILEDRLSKKKLNKLSLIYMLNKENGEYDESNNPIVINTFDYNVDEIAIKLKSLKEWLEKHILSLNCRIVDITGEGVVYEKIPLKIYGTNMQNFDYEDYLEFTPMVEEESVVLKDGSANIKIFIKNNSTSSYLQIEDVPDKIGEFSEFATIQYPYINSMYAKAFIECENAKIDSTNGYLFVNEGNIYLEKNKDTFIFDKAPIVYLEKGRLKELKYNVNESSTYYDWWCKNDYTVSVSNEEDYSYYIKNEQSGEIYNSIDYICFLPIEKEGLEPSLRYTSNVIKKEENGKIIYYSILESPVFILKDYTICTYDKDFNFEKIELKGEYIIEILDGKIVINEKENKTSYINISYNEENEERYISVNYQYEGYKEDEADYINIEVNNIGHYDIVTYAINDSGNIFSKKVDGGCDVLIENKDIKIGTNKEKIENDKDFYIDDSSGDAENIKLNNNNYPSFKPIYMINFLSVDVNPISYKYSNIKYAYNTPNTGDYIQFMNICDKFYYEGNKKFIKYFNNYNKIKEGNKVCIVEYDINVLNGRYEYEGVVEEINENIYTIRISDESFKDKNGKYFYILPIDEKEVNRITIDEGKNETTITLSNEDKNSYSKGEVIKIKYYVAHNVIVTDDNKVYYKDNVDGTFYPVIDEYGNHIFYVENIPLMKLAKNKSNISEKFYGSATFRIKNIEGNKITLDGIFNYRELSNIYLTSSLTISKANQAYVNYILSCVGDSYCEDNFITLNVKDSKFDYFIDHTYSFIPLSFDKNNAFNYWDSTGRYTYVHKNTPLTLSKEDRIIVYHEEDVKNTIYWRLYRRSIDTETRELLFEVVNDNLPLNISDEGIYDIEMDIFDIYGNKSHNCYNAILKVK